MRALVRAQFMPHEQAEIDAFEPLEARDHPACDGVALNGPLTVQATMDGAPSSFTGAFFLLGDFPGSATRFDAGSDASMSFQLTGGAGGTEFIPIFGRWGGLSWTTDGDW